MILDLGKAVKASSVTVKFGPVPGANVQIKVGNSDARSAANLNSMTTVASETNVSGTTTFQIPHPVSGQYLVIWFTKLPPLSGQAGKYEEAIYSPIQIKGTS